MKKGDIVYLNYDAWIMENDELYDTTDIDHAKENEIYDEKATYRPLPIVVGADKVVKGLDDHMLKAKVGKEYKVEIEPKDGFGERDPKLVEMHSRREIMRLPEFKKGDKEPMVGMRLVLNNRICWISAVTAGRVRVDYNNRYAGRRLKYSYKITEHAEKHDAKVKAILDMHYGKVEDFDLVLKKNDVKIKLPDACKYDLNWFQSKYRVVDDLRKYASINNVQFIEEYVKKVETPKKDDKKDKDAKDKQKTSEKEKDSKDDVKAKDTKDAKDKPAAKSKADTKDAKDKTAAKSKADTKDAKGTKKK